LVALHRVSNNFCEIHAIQTFGCENCPIILIHILGCNRLSFAKLQSIFVVFNCAWGRDWISQLFNYESISRQLNGPANEVKCAGICNISPASGASGRLGAVY